jgi:hypothetical protein
MTSKKIIFLIDKIDNLLTTVSVSQVPKTLAEIKALDNLFLDLNG